MDEATKKFFEDISKGATPDNPQGEDTPPAPMDGGEASLVVSKRKMPKKDDDLSIATQLGGGGIDDIEEGEGQLTIDVYQTDNDIVVESPIAGVSPEDLDISITSDSVTIRGRRERQQEVKHDDYYYQECYWGTFSRAVVLPAEVDADKAQATMKNGVLTIRLPKVQRKREQKVKVKFN